MSCFFAYPHTSFVDQCANGWILRSDVPVGNVNVSTSTMLARVGYCSRLSDVNQMS